jgi:hypothetical protein
MYLSPAISLADTDTIEPTIDTFTGIPQALTATRGAHVKDRTSKDSHFLRNSNAFSILVYWPLRELCVLLTHPRADGTGDGNQQPGLSPWHLMALRHRTKWPAPR